MDSIATAAAAVLSGVFCLAALAKLRAPSTTARSFLTLRIPGLSTLTRAHQLRVAVLIVELTTAALLLVRPRFGAAIGFVTLVAFSFVLFRATKVKSSLDEAAVVRCGCFGSVGDDRVTSTTFVRNGLLLLVSAIAMFAVHPVWRLPSTMIVLDGVLICALVLQFVAIRSKGPLLPKVSTSSVHTNEVTT